MHWPLWRHSNIGRCAGKCEGNNKRCDGRCGGDCGRHGGCMNTFEVGLVLSVGSCRECGSARVVGLGKPIVGVVVIANGLVVPV